VALVFEAFQRQITLEELLAQRAALAEEGATGPEAEIKPDTLALVQGVAEHQEEISEWLDTYSRGWPQYRMPGVDRAILYVGAYQVVLDDDVPDTQAIRRAADTAGKYSTDKSANFVSGLLGTLSKIKPTLI
jgi:N utilization substance protein B